MIFKLLCLGLILYSLYDYKSSLILFLGYKMLLTTNATLVSVPGIPLLTIDMFMSIYYVIFFYLVYQKKYAKVSFPFLTPMLLYIVAIVISAIFSKAGLKGELSVVIGTIFQDIFFMVILWNVFETKKDFKKIFVVITIVFFSSVMFGLIESKLHNNPFLLYQVKMNSDASKVVDITDPVYMLIQRGFRIRSFFEHPIGAGVNWALYVAFIFISWIQYEECQVVNVLSLLTIVGAIPCILLTKMRTPLVFLFLALLGGVNVKKKRLYYLAVAFPLIVFLARDYIIDNSHIIFSLFSKKIQTSIGGSTLEGRIHQFIAGLKLYAVSPVWGLGSKFGVVIKNDLTDAILGMESIWLKVMIEYGILGILSQIIMAYYQIIKIPRYFHAKELFYLSGSFWIMRTITSIPGMHVYLYYLFIIYAIKRSNVYKNLKATGLSEWKCVNGKILHKKHLFSKNL